MDDDLVFNVGVAGQAIDGLYFLRSGDYSDINLQCDGEHIKVHKVFICMGSEYFQHMLHPKSRFLEASSELVTFHDAPFDAATLRIILHHLYGGNIQLTVRNIVAVTVSADYLGITDLVAKCLASFSAAVGCINWNASNVSCIIHVLNDAVDAKQDALINCCTSIIADNFETCMDARKSLLDVRLKSMCCILDMGDRLNVCNEMVVLGVVRRYVEEHPGLGDQEQKNLFAYVRMEFTSTSVLCDMAAGATSMDQQQLLSAMAERLTQPFSSSRSQPRKSYERFLTRLHQRVHHKSSIQCSFSTPVTPSRFTLSYHGEAEQQPASMKFRLQAFDPDRLLWVNIDELVVFERIRGRVFERDVVLTSDAYIKFRLKSDAKLPRSLKFVVT